MKIYISILINLFLISNNLHSQWNIIYQNEQVGCISDMHFTNSENGFFVGGNKFIGKTDNNGLTWTIDSSFAGLDFRIIDFSDQDTGLICCYPNSGAQNVLITFDGGENWNAPPLNNGVNFKDMVLVDGGKIIFSELFGDQFVYSFIAGNYYEYNLFSTNLTVGSSLWELEFPSKDIGFITGDFVPLEPVTTSVYKTIDGGLSWYTNDNMYGPLYSINFPSTQIGYGIGYEQRVWKTIDAGESWFMLPFDFGGYEVYDNDLNVGGVYFFNDTIGYLEAHYYDFDKYQILRTIDGGNSWYPTEMLDPDFNGLSGFFCVSSDTCFAFRCYEIYKTTNGGGIDTTTTLITSHEKFTLKLYPNPTNNIVSVECNEVAEYTIYNLSGNLVQSGDLIIGKNDLLVSDLPSGLYSISIITKKGSSLYKIIVL